MTSKIAGRDVISGPKYRKIKRYKKTAVKMILALNRPIFDGTISGPIEYSWVPSTYNQIKINNNCKGIKILDGAGGRATATY